ncbi:hypothetical protein [Nostoc sp.]
MNQNPNGKFKETPTTFRDRVTAMVLVGLRQKQDAITSTFPGVSVGASHFNYARNQRFE